MTLASVLDNTCSFFFFSGLVFSKIQYFPIPFVASFANIISLLSYMLGYFFWFLSSNFYPEQSSNSEEWYGFAQFKEQQLYASILGFVAACLSAIALFVPALFLPAFLIPAALLFVASNIMWTVGEYNKLHNPPPNEDDYSHRYQETFLNYAIIITSLSCVAALSTCLIFIFPLFAPLIYTSTLVIGIGLIALAAEVWLSFTFGNPDHSILPSKKSIRQLFDLPDSETLSEKNELSPHQSPTPFFTPSPSPENSELESEEEESDSEATFTTASSP